VYNCFTDLVDCGYVTVLVNIVDCGCITILADVVDCGFLIVPLTLDI
jgi:hypothetical protein